MAKRFTDTEIYDEDWFIALEPDHKLMWDYLTKKCDTAGIWRINLVSAQLLIGLSKPIDLTAFIKACNTDGKIRIEKVGNKRLWITGFIGFQYGKNGELPSTNLVWSTLDELDTFGLDKSKLGVALPSRKSDVSLSGGIGVLVNDVISYLNNKSKKVYKADSKNNINYIVARLNDGFTIDDFKAVIDYKVAEWINDEKYNQYLRPQTLFGNKFEGYLQAANSQVRPGSAERFEWVCPKGHQQKRKIIDIADAYHKCPVCKKRLVIKK